MLSCPSGGVEHSRRSAAAWFHAYAVCHGGSGYGVGQPVRERQMRRLIRQIRECRVRGSRMPGMLVSSLSSSGSPTRFPVPKGLGIMFGIGVGICLRLGLKSFFRTPLGLGRMLHGSGGAVRFTTSVRRVSGLTLSLLPGWLKTRATALFTLARLLRPTVCAAGGAGPTAYDSPRLLGDCVARVPRGLR